MQGGEPQLPDGVTLGEVFAGKYRVDAIIGWGAMGIVVAAHHLLLDRPVAIKFLLAASERPDALTRFLREARAAGRLRSEHVVRVLDVDVHETGAPSGLPSTLSSGLPSGPPYTVPYTVPYIVMERLFGSDLSAVLRAAGSIPVETAVDHVLEACEAIAEAHRLEIVHRDLKPANLFLAHRDGVAPIIKVLDFGIAKSLSLVPKTIDWVESSSSAVITQERAILGSPFYMSPEQMESSGDVDRRTDIWALGVTLFELVTGKPPYTGTSLVQVYSRITALGEPAWRSEGVSLPPALDVVIEKCLKRARDARYASVGELAAALAPFGSTMARDSEARIRKAVALHEFDTGTVNVVTPRPVTSPTTGGVTRGEGRISRPAPARARGRWAMGAVGTVVTAGLASAFVMHRPSPPPPEVQSSEMHAPDGPTPPSGIPVVPTAAPGSSSAPSGTGSTLPPVPPTTTAGLLSLPGWGHHWLRPSPPGPGPGTSASMDASSPVAPAPSSPVSTPPAFALDAAFDAKALLESRQ
jgi:serine/threonine protein kinase